MFVYTTSFSSEVVGSAIRRIVCETCDKVYFYELTRVGQGDGTTIYGVNKRGAKDRAETRASNNLQAMLQYDHDPVPCPNCGHVQEVMRAWTIRRRALKMLGNGLGLLVFTLVIGSLILGASGGSETAWKFGGGLLVCALMTLIVVFFRCRRFDVDSFAALSAQSPALLAPPALLPETGSEEQSRLSPASPPTCRVDKQTVTGQFLRGLPSVCCCCLNETDHLYVPSFGITAMEAPVVCCQECSANLRKRAWIAMLGTWVVVFVISWFATILFSVDEFGRIIVPVMLAAIPGSILAMICGQRVGRAWKTYDIDRTRGWIAIRPRSLEVAEWLAQLYSSPETYVVTLDTPKE